MLGLLQHTFTSRDPDLWLKLYKTYIRPKLEFAVSVWNPFLIKDVKALEGVQHRATKIAQSMKGHNYEERCDIYDLTSLETRRIRGDMIQFYKFEKDIDTVNWLKAPYRAPARGMNNREYLRSESVHCSSARRNFFNNRVVESWNGLPEETIHAESVDRFKAAIDTHIRTNDIYSARRTVYESYFQNVESEN